MKRKLPIIIFISAFILLGLSGIAHAEMKYTLLESFPGFFTGDEQMTDFPKMILAIYKFGIWTVGIAGLFMLVIGGFWYMTSAGNNATAETAKKIIWDSLLGIAAALAAYLIMYVINPDLTNISINFVKVSTSTTTSTTSTTSTTTPGGAAGGTDATVRAQLLAAGISVNKSNCPTPADTNCTSLDGIPTSTITNIIKLKNACVASNSSCSVTITGGTEAGHSSHGPGKPRLDVSTNAALKTYLLQLKASANLGSFGITQICATNADANLRYNCSTVETVPHYHFSFSG